MFRYNNKFFQYLLITFISTIGIVACGISRTSSDVVKDSTANEKTLLWEISGQGLEKSSYLFGTMHIICQEDYIWTPVMDAAMKSSDALIMEMDISDAKMQMSLAKQMMFGKDTTLDMFLSPEKIKDLEVAFEDNMILKMSFKKMKPTFAATILSMDAFTCDDKKSYEEIISKYFKDEKKPLIGLESLEEQVTALTSQPYDVAAQQLYEAVMDEGKNKKDLEKMSAMYKLQDVDGMADMVHADKQYGAMSESLLYNRNKNWVERLPALMAGRRTFIAVGAAHLGSKGGLIDLLRKAGYTVTPVK